MFNSVLILVKNKIDVIVFFLSSFASASVKSHHTINTLDFLCRVVDGTEDSEGMETFSYTQGRPILEPTSASASTTGPPVSIISIHILTCNRFPQANPSDTV